MMLRLLFLFGLLVSSFAASAQMRYGLIFDGDVDNPKIVNYGYKGNHGTVHWKDPIAQTICEKNMGARLDHYKEIKARSDLNYYVNILQRIQFVSLDDFISVEPTLSNRNFACAYLFNYSYRERSSVDAPYGPVQTRLIRLVWQVHQSCDHNYELRGDRCVPTDSCPVDDTFIVVTSQSGPYPNRCEKRGKSWCEAIPGGTVEVGPPEGGSGEGGGGSVEGFEKSISYVYTGNYCDPDESCPKGQRPGTGPTGERICVPAEDPPKDPPKPGEEPPKPGDGDPPENPPKDPPKPGEEPPKPGGGGGGGSNDNPPPPPPKDVPPPTDNQPPKDPPKDPKPGGGDESGTAPGVCPPGTRPGEVNGVVGCYRSEAPGSQKCPAGQTKDEDGKCVSACPSGTSWDNGKCIVIGEQPKCPPGYQLNNGLCVGGSGNSPGAKCPDGYTKSGNLCIGSPRPGGGAGGTGSSDDGEEDGEEGSFGGGCDKGWQCEGDAVLCALATEQHKRNCEMLQPAKPGDEGVDVIEGTDGYTKEGFEGGGTGIDLGTFDTEGYGWSRSCPADPVFQFNFGRDVELTIPFSRYCGVLRLLANAAVAVTLMGAMVFVLKPSAGSK
ncbi:hypothetical protein [Vandammella animalimorsus]|nr:hypothetical protein [Vandammella animalimorsus]